MEDFSHHSAPISEAENAQVDESDQENPGVVDEEEEDSEHTANGRHLRAFASLQKAFWALWNLCLWFLACLPQVLLKGSPVLIGIVLAALAQALLTVSIVFRAEFRGRRGASWLHGVAFIAILMVLFFILLCALARWNLRFQSNQKKNRVDSKSSSNNIAKGSQEAAVPGDLEPATVNEPLGSGENHQNFSEVPGEVNNERPDVESSPEQLGLEPTETTPDSLNGHPEVVTETANDRKLKHFLLHKTKWLALLLFLPLTILLVLLTEVVFFYEMPRNSIIPLSPNQNALNPDSEWVPEGCDIQERWDKAVKFFNGSVVVGDVMLVYVTHILGHSSAAAYESDITIYFPDEAYWCPPEWLLVHELVHVWQEQTGYWSGPGAIGRVIQMELDRRSCSYCLYDYGGPDALISSMHRALEGNETAKDVVTAFGPEQMAEIVEDYYLYKVDYGYCNSVVAEDAYSWRNDIHELLDTTGNNTTAIDNTSDQNSSYSSTAWDNVSSTSTDDGGAYYRYNDDIDHGEYCEALHYYSCQIISC